MRSSTPLRRIGAGALHWHRENINWQLALKLLYGSIPGAVLGVLLLAHIHAVYGNGVNDVLKMAIAVLLIFIPIIYMFIQFLSASQVNNETIRNNEHSPGVTLIGFVAGYWWVLRRLGRASIILMLLLVFYDYAPAIMVGTDIVHATLPADVTGLLQFGFGNGELVLVAGVLIESIPGGLLGAYLTKYFPSERFKQTLCSVLVLVAARMMDVRSTC
jgi:uncharacterized protein